MNRYLPRLIGWGVAAVLCLCLLSGFFYSIDQGDRGVILCNGAICGEADAGLHWKTPLIQSVAELDFHSQKFEISLGTPTTDKQLATVDLVVQWHPTNPQRIYADLKTIQNVADQIIRPKAQEVLGAEIGKINSTEAINNRDAVSQVIQARLQKVVGDTGVAVVSSAIVTHIKLPDAYMDAVNQTLQAQVAVQTAKANYESTKINADTQAYQKTAIAQAEATAIKLRGDALRENPGLPELIRAEAQQDAVKKWNGQLPSTMVPGQTVPFISVGK
jgi:regulator of protease activity HflC (stomatin/prohibitin superfamily)